MKCKDCTKFREYVSERGYCSGGFYEDLVYLHESSGCKDFKGSMLYRAILFIKRILTEEII